MGREYISEDKILSIVEHLYSSLIIGTTIIITGSKGSGKSYLLKALKNKLITEDKTFAGIETIAKRDDEFYPKGILLYNIGSVVRAGVLGGNLPLQTLKREVVIARRNENGIGLVPNIETFNNDGVEMLKATINMDIAIIDEIGFLEEDAEEYKRTIRETISNKPSIIVLAKRDTPFIKELIGLENAEIFDIDKQYI